MASFPYQQQQQQLLSLPNPNYLMNNPSIDLSLQPHQAHQSITHGYTYYFPSESIAEASTPHESISSLDNGSKASVVQDKLLKPQSSFEKKRKGRVRCCFSSNQSNKDAKEKKSRKKKEKEARDGEVEDTKGCEEPSKGYIHVRARRGQATDSHSLAERVRREKISLKFKVLQGLVPGCDQVVGKALLLDEIINYVQSLQNQVEFLSMKLASMNPLLHDFGMDFDDFLNPQEKMGSMPSTMPPMTQAGHIQTTTFGVVATNNHQMMGISAPILLHAQGPTSISQDGSSLPVPVEFHNMCSFQ